MKQTAVSFNLFESYKTPDGPVIENRGIFKEFQEAHDKMVSLAEEFQNSYDGITYVVDCYNTIEVHDSEDRLKKWQIKKITMDMTIE